MALTTGTSREENTEKKGRSPTGNSTDGLNSPTTAPKQLLVHVCCPERFLPSEGQSERHEEPRGLPN